MSAVEMARAGTNTACVDCSSHPLSGGLRCLPCFQKRAHSRLTAGHDCLLHGPSLLCYARCRCRCSGCRKESARVQRERRQSLAGAA